MATHKSANRQAARRGRLSHTGRSAPPYTFPQTTCIAPVPKPRISRKRIWSAPFCVRKQMFSKVAKLAATMTAASRKRANVGSNTARKNSSGSSFMTSSTTGAIWVAALTASA